VISGKKTIREIDGNGGFDDSKKGKGSVLIYLEDKK